MTLADEIRRQNLQWREKKLAPNTTKREIEPEIQKELKENIVTSITGMRRVGKTTLLHRTIDRLTKKINPTRTLYFSFDLEKPKIKDLLDTYFQEIRKTNPENAGKTYVFLDEVQKINNWSDAVKAYHDTHKNLKFIVTGSSSANIKRGGGESLVGRITLHKLTPFTFREYLKHQGIETPEKNFSELPAPTNANLIKAKLEEYIEKGGLPEMFFLPKAKKEDRLEDIIELTLFRDVIRIFDLERPELLESILKIISSNSGQILNYDKLSRDLNAGYKTIKKYIEDLKYSFLIKISRRLENNVLKKYRKRPKAYASDHSLCNLENTKKGLTVETVAFNHLNTLGETGYWRENGKEVDIILKREGKTNGFEIKYREKTRKSDLEGLRELQKAYPESDNYLITKNDLDRESKIKKIPLWLLLLHI